MPGPIWVLPLGGTVAIAAASYYGVERPLLRLKRRFSRVSSLSP
jgi:peptidoglycan/LPS O-acetylase OafA/YrhL